MFLTKCASKIREARKTGSWGNKHPATDLGERGTKQAQNNLPELLNATFMIVICRVSIGNVINQSPNQLQATYPCGAGRSWRISSTKMDVRNSQTFSHRGWKAPWSLMNWTKSSWDFIPMGKWYWTPYMARLRTTVAFQMLSSWDLDTIRKYF